MYASVLQCTELSISIGGHCQRFAPDYEKIADNLKDIVNVGAVDATVENALASEYKIKVHASF